MNGMVDAWCEGCEYISSAGGYVTCDHLLITGRRRGCPPGKGCTARRRPRRWSTNRRLRQMTAAQEAAAAAEETARKRREAALAKLNRPGPGRPKTENAKSQSELNRQWLLRRRERPERQLQAKAILAWRKRKKLSQGAAAELLQISRVCMGAWERGERAADWSILEAKGCKRPKGAEK